jgi:hypothetical protein
MKRLALTSHTVRCPLEDRSASLTVRTDPGAAPSRRHRDVATCSLLPPPTFVPPARSGYFADVAPPLAYLCGRAPMPWHSSRVACGKACVAVLNAAEPGADTVGCTSGVSDSLELARRTQSAGILRVLWFHGA